MSELVDAFRHARTSAEHNRARLALQRFGTPQEVRTVARELPDLPREVCDWVVRLDEYCSWEQPDVAIFSRETEPSAGEDWILYRTADAVAQPQLLVGFAGAVGNIFQPAPVVLQHLPRGAYDVLLLNDPLRGGYTAGVAVTADLVELTARIARLAAGYPDVVTYGTSSGGHPALHVGAALGARRAVSVGGHPRDDLPQLATMLERGRSTELLCVHGAQHVRDRVGAAELARQLPGAVAVAVAEVAAHNVQHAAFQGGRLTALLAALLGAAELPVRPVAPSEAAPSELDRPSTRRSLLLDLPAHRPAAAPAWARVAGTPGPPPRRLAGLLRVPRRR